MRTVAVLPLNHLSLVKSRLSRVQVDRPTLALELLARVVRVLGDVDEVAARWVVCPDPAVSGRVQKAEWVPQTGEPGGDGLNAALRTALQKARDLDYQRFLVILPDLPFLESGEVRDFLHLVQEPGTLALAADRWNRGTNLWLSRLEEGSTFPEFRFGEGSLAAHQREAERAGWRCQVFHSPGCERDLDTPDDWEEFRWNLPFSCCR